MKNFWTIYIKTGLKPLVENFWGFLGGALINNPPAEMQEMWVWSLGQEDPLEEEMATHSNTLA